MVREPGSRGGIVVRYTKSGNPIYQSGRVKLSFVTDPDKQLLPTCDRHDTSEISFYIPGIGKGSIWAKLKDEGKTVHISDIFVGDSTESKMIRGKLPSGKSWSRRVEVGTGTLGPSNVRHILRALKQIYPSMERIEGVRITGARPKSAKASLLVRSLALVIPLEKAKRIIRVRSSMRRTKKGKVTPVVEHPRLIGFTKTDRPIYNDAHPAHKTFTPQDHLDAARIHAFRASQTKHPLEQMHQRERSRKHARLAVKKSEGDVSLIREAVKYMMPVWEDTEGSTKSKNKKRKHKKLEITAKLFGHTDSGKPIYNLRLDNPVYADYNEREMQDVRRVISVRNPQILEEKPEEIVDPLGHIRYRNPYTHVRGLWQ